MNSEDKVLTSAGPVASRIVEALGLTDKHVTSVHIKIDSQSIATADVNVELYELQGEALAATLRDERYVLISRAEYDLLKSFYEQQSVRDAP